MKLKICACLFLIAVASSMAKEQPRVTGFFSDMHYIKEAGDILGTEIWIVYARDHYWATVQEAGGEPEPPVVVPVKLIGVSKVRFTITIPAVNTKLASHPVRVIRYGNY